jgi:hypothetical protein
LSAVAAHDETGHSVFGSRLYSARLFPQERAAFDDPCLSACEPKTLWIQEPVPAKTTPMVRTMILKSTQRFHVSMYIISSDT